MDKSGVGMCTPYQLRRRSRVFDSPNYFGDLIKKETGQTAMDYIHRHIIDAAKELLADTSRSITDVSYQIGFQYPQHMSRMFKKETGGTPAQYRKQITA